MTNDQHALRFAPDVVLQVIDGEALLIKLHDEVVFALNETGTRIAQLIGQGVGTRALIDCLAAEYEAGRAEVEEEVNTLLGALIARGVVVASPEEGTR